MHKALLNIQRVQAGYRRKHQRTSTILDQFTRALHLAAQGHRATLRTTHYRIAICRKVIDGGVKNRAFIAGERQILFNGNASGRHTNGALPERGFKSLGRVQALLAQNQLTVIAQFQQNRAVPVASMVADALHSHRTTVYIDGGLGGAVAVTQSDGSILCQQLTLNIHDTSCIPLAKDDSGALVLCRICPQNLQRGPRTDVEGQVATRRIAALKG